MSLQRPLSPFQRAPMRPPASISNVSPNTLAQRRRQRRRQRRMRALQAGWRLVVVSALAVGAIWLIKSPVWIIQNGNQIKVQGNERLSADRVRSLLPIRYPQPLWAIRPEAIAQHLEARGPIAQATVTRRLVPPGVDIEIQERRPVAIAQGFWADVTPTDELGTSRRTDTGLLDATGAWIPIADYSTLDPSLEMPKLTVIGMRESDRTQWAEVYATLTQFRTATPNALPITQIDWRSPSNLILITPLAPIHLGAYDSPDHLMRQLQALQQLETLGAQSIDYIDLAEPEAPFIHIQTPGR